MIVDIEDTTAAKVSKKLAELREAGGVVALSRVLTLVILTSQDNVEHVIEAANLASREHPCRVIVLATGNPQDPIRLDAQIRVGGDAGASEVLVLRRYGKLAEESAALISALLLPDAPIVAWWADELPHRVSHTPVGRIAHRRITDTARSPRPLDALNSLSHSYSEGDSDLAWTRLTGWRIQLASIFDTFDAASVTSVTVESAVETPSGGLLAAWLHMALGVPVELVRSASSHNISAVHIHRTTGNISLSRGDDAMATLHLPDAPSQQVPLPERTLEDCLTEELRRLDADEVFGDVITRGLPETDISACRAA